MRYFSTAQIIRLIYRMLNKYIHGDIFISIHRICVWTHKICQCSNKQKSYRMNLNFETRDIFWSPSLYQKLIAEALLKSIMLMLYRQALLQPPAIYPLPEGKIRLTYICADSQENLGMIYDQLDQATELVVPWGPPIATPRRKREICNFRRILFTYRCRIRTVQAILPGHQRILHIRKT